MIRPYKSRDLPDVLAAWEAASAVAHPFLSETFVAAERRDVEDVYLPNAETWVWEAGGRVVGFISLVGPEVGGLFVYPAYHRRGIGRALVDHAQSVRGAIEVEVFEANTVGRAFYARYGFVPVAERAHEATGLRLLRLRYPPASSSQSEPRL